jgi:hypothetical protein
MPTLSQPKGFFISVQVTGFLVAITNATEPGASNQKLALNDPP